GRLDSLGTLIIGPRRAGRPCFSWLSRLLFLFSKMGRLAYSQHARGALPSPPLGDANRGARTWPKGRGEHSGKARRTDPPSGGLSHSQSPMADALGRRPTAKPAETRSRRRRRSRVESPMADALGRRPTARPAETRS